MEGGLSQQWEGKAERVKTASVQQKDESALLLTGSKRYWTEKHAFSSLRIPYLNIGEDSDGTDLF